MRKLFFPKVVLFQFLTGGGFFESYLFEQLRYLRLRQAIFLMHFMILLSLVAF
jgi:hypothetical protein